MEVSAVLSQLSGERSQFARLGPASIAMTLLALLLTPDLTQAQGTTARNNEEAIFSLEGPRVKLMLQKASAAEAGRNLQQASELYCRAAAYGSLEADYRLARIILASRTTAENSAIAEAKLQMAATLLRNAAGNGHVGAQAMIVVTGEQKERLPDCLGKSTLL